MKLADKNILEMNKFVKWAYKLTFPDVYKSHLDCNERKATMEDIQKIIIKAIELNDSIDDISKEQLKRDVYRETEHYATYIHDDYVSEYKSTNRVSYVHSFAKGMLEGYALRILVPKIISKIF